MNFNRLVKRYKVDVAELTVPSDQEVEARKVERIVSQLAAKGQDLPLEDFAEFSSIARRIAEHEYRDRIVALLLRGHFQPAPAEDLEEDAAPAPPAPSFQRGHGDGHRRRRRRR
jgi:hypothetical protein